MLDGISWFWWALGSFGVGGIIIMVVLWFTIGPAVVLKLLDGFIAIFKVALSTRTGCAIMAAMVAFFLADIHRSKMDAADWAKKTAQFEQDQKDRDQRIADETREEVWKGIADATANNEEIDKEVKSVETAIVPTGSVRYLVGADSCRLRQLAGQTGCGPESAQGVPKAGTQAKPAGDHKRLRLPGTVRRFIGRDQKGTARHQGA